MVEAPAYPTIDRLSRWLFEEQAAFGPGSKPWQFWEIAMHVRTEGEYMDELRRGQKRFRVGPPRFMGFRVVADNDVPEGEFHLRLR